MRRIPFLNSYQRWVLSLVCLLLACRETDFARAAEATPVAVVRAAPLLSFRGANSSSATKPGDTDCNSPGHWEGETLYVFNSAGHPWRSAGRDLFHLDQEYLRCQYNNQTNGGRWIECTWKSDEGALYGWYHFEPTGLCPGTTLTAPRIGAARSTDNGAHWEDLGVILEARPNTLRCQTKNYYFAGGNGDFSAIPDAEREYIYFFISTYAGDAVEQGVSVARMRYIDRDHPVGRVWKWCDGQWREPGVSGRVTPIFAATVDWNRADANAFWGPSIHWNTHLRQFVILLNRTQDSDWTQEGIYVSFNPDLAQPKAWTAPVKILPSQGKDRWYPQIFGTDSAGHETDKLAGQTARLFLRGQSRWEIEFLRPSQQPAGPRR